MKKHFYSKDNSISLKESLFTRAAVDKNVTNMEIYANAIAYAIKEYGPEEFNDNLKNIGFTPSIAGLLQILSPIKTSSGMLYVDKVKNKLKFELVDEQSMLGLRNPSMRINVDDLYEMNAILQSLYSEGKTCKVKIDGKLILVQFSKLKYMGDGVFKGEHSNLLYFYKENDEICAKEVIII